MFPNAVMMEPGTWEEILATMIAVRDATVGGVTGERRHGDQHAAFECRTGGLWVYGADSFERVCARQPVF